MLSVVARASLPTVSVAATRLAACAAAHVARRTLATSAAPGRRVAPEFDAELAETANLDVLKRLSDGTLPHHKLEAEVKDTIRAVKLRRAHVAESLANPDSLENLPVEDFNAKTFYDSVHGTNCECVIGYVPVPVGVVGPVLLDAKEYRYAGAQMMSRGRNLHSFSLLIGPWCTLALVECTRSRALGPERPIKR